MLKVEHIYEFTGKSNADLGYIKGREYDLNVAKRTLKSRVTGVFLGIPFGWKIVVLEPAFCPYESVEAFLENWKIKRVSIRG